MIYDHVVVDIQKGRISFDIQADTCVPGTRAIIATTPSLPYPIGLIWYCWRGGYAIDILNMFVVADLRRLGIATALLANLIKCYPDDDPEFYTQVGNDLSTPWLKAAGFKKLATGWYLRPKKPKRRAKAKA